MPRERTEHDSATYRRNRALILQGSPICHYCRRRPATEADHIIEVDRGGDSSLDNCFFAILIKKDSIFEQS